MNCPGCGPAHQLIGRAVSDVEDGCVLLALECPFCKYTRVIREDPELADATGVQLTREAQADLDEDVAGARHIRDILVSD